MPSDRDVFRAPKGTHDVLPPESARWEAVVATFAERARRSAFGLVVSPVFEHVEVFHRVGETTDVVRKEMYEFEDRGGRRLALRPEGTAPVVRAFAQHQPPTPWKVWYLAPNFRYERPQQGRYRQHWQLGVEVLGVDDPGIDVEVVALAHGFLADLGLTQVRLLVNSMGDEESRSRYRTVLLEYWRAHADLLGDDMERAEANPLRILDSKRDDWFDMLERAPQIIEYLTPASAEQFEQAQQGLRALAIDFTIAPRLVRGFDYYTGIAFEFVSDALDAAQSTVCGGGRYDRLVEQMGGPPTAGIGFGMGVERLLIASEHEGVDPAAGRSALDVFVVDAVGDGLLATVVVHELREAGLAADRTYGGRTVKKQMGAADKSGARFCVVLGARELERNHIVVKDLRTGDQIEIRREEIAAWLMTKREET